MRKKKILVAASQINPDVGSEGICTSKFLSALAGSGYEILCLTDDRGFVDSKKSSTFSWLPGIPITHIRNFTSSKKKGINQKYDEILNALIARKSSLAHSVDIGIGYLTGFTFLTWKSVSLWEVAIKEAIREEQPDIIFVRGAGLAFEPHIAMTRIQTDVPWVANYHDPFPISLYPEPYRTKELLLSSRQEALHKDILRKADALTFHSSRLLEWVLQDGFDRHRSKAFVIPHIAMDLVSQNNIQAAALHTDSVNGDFNIVHVGSLHGPREPWALINGFLDFINSSPERKLNSSLHLIGNTNKKHSSNSIWGEIQNHPNIKILDRRISYRESIEILRRATASVIIEADAYESTLFPYKLVDAMWMNKPIIALSPPNSVVADVLGKEYPLLIRPGDQNAVRQALSILWDANKAGKITELLPTSSSLSPLTEDSVIRSLAGLFAYLV